jgi:hypothetical protein
MDVKHERNLLPTAYICPCVLVITTSRRCLIEWRHSSTYSQSFPSEYIYELSDLGPDSFTEGLQYLVPPGKKVGWAPGGVSLDMERKQYLLQPSGSKPGPVSP